MPYSERTNFIAFQCDPHIKEALDLACNPRLPLNERFDALMTNIHMPTIRNTSEASSSSGPTFETISNWMNKFIRSDEGKRYYEQLSQVCTLLDDEIGTRTQIFTGRYNKYCKLLFGDPQPMRYGKYQVDMVEQTGLNAFKLLRMLTYVKETSRGDNSIAIQNVRANLSELSKSLILCGPAIVQNFDDAVNNIRTQVFSMSLPERAEQLRIEIVRNTILAYENNVLSREERKQVAMEIHRIATWQNYFSQEFNLPYVRDQFANNKYLANPHRREGMRAKLAKVQTVSAVSAQLAEVILEKARDTWNGLQKKGFLNLPNCVPLIVKNVERQYGRISAHHLIETDDDGMPTGVMKDPLPLTVKIIEELSQPGITHHLQPESRDSWASTRRMMGQGNAIVHSQGGRYWLEIAPAPNSGQEPTYQQLLAKNMDAHICREFLLSLFSDEGDVVYRKEAMQAMVNASWENSLPYRRSTESTYEPDEVFIDLAFGASRKEPLGELDLTPHFGDIMKKVIDFIYESKVFKFHSEEQMHELFLFTHNWNQSMHGKTNPVHFKYILRNVTSGNRCGVDIDFYRAALRFNWTHDREFAEKQSRHYPDLLYPRSGYGSDYLDVMGRCAPDLLPETFRHHLKFMNCPKLIESFEKVGQRLDQPMGNTGRIGVDIMLNSPSDNFVLTCLKRLQSQGFDLSPYVQSNAHKLLAMRGLEESWKFLIDLK